MPIATCVTKAERIDSSIHNLKKTGFANWQGAIQVLRNAFFPEHGRQACQRTTALFTVYRLPGNDNNGVQVHANAHVAPLSESLVIYRFRMVNNCYYSSIHRF